MEISPGEQKAEEIIDPNYYSRYTIEPSEFIIRNDLPYFAGCVIKYLCRAGTKLYCGRDAKASKILDLKKARRYIDMELNRLQGEKKL